MPTLNLKPTHKPIREYYAALERFDRLGVSHESAARAAFQALLEHCARQCAWTLVPEHAIAPLSSRGASNTARGNKRIIVDGALIDDFQLPHGIWEAKDIHDDLLTAARRKFEAGYPHDNILFQTPQRAILWQNGRQVLDADLSGPAQLIGVLEAFFGYRPQEYAAWEEAVAQCKDRVPDIGRGLALLIHKERQSNSRFATAFGDFLEKCRQSINPNLSEAAVEEMLIQHLLTERLFRTVFNNPDFTRRNVIANEIENVIDALTSQSFSRRDFLHSLDRFYVVIERVAATINDFSQKQHFLNTVYEQFFQGFSVKVADTHGIVYTPQPIVDFMAQSVAHILQSEFGRSLSDPGVHIIDPFVGTGNFIVRLMREIRRTALEDKYRSELHCNEVMLLPSYIASLNIEHEFYAATDTYQPFEGICLVDTFDLAEDRQLPLCAPANTQRLDTQKRTPMFVVIGNPPYNVGQVNENDNNKNRKYETLDKRVAETYAQASKATNKNKLSDPYVKAIRWASDRIGEEGIVAFITNNSFLDAVAFDGMRKHLADDFDTLYSLDLGGNARKGLKVSDANVFGIRVGVSINLFVKRRGGQPQGQLSRIFYYRTDDLWDKKRKFDFLHARQHAGNIEWREIRPDRRHTWLTEGLHAEFESFIPLGGKDAKASKGEAVDVIFHTFSNGVQTGRDAWACNFNRDALTENMKRTIDTYNEQVFRWKGQANQGANVDDFVVYDDKKIKWSSSLKQKLKGRQIAEFTEAKIRQSLYRPFTKTNLFFDRILTHRVFIFPSIFPTAQTETENRVIIVSDHGFRADFTTLMTNLIPDLHALAASDGFQCFPFYVYDEDGTNRRENITDWALAQFRRQYSDDAIGKWDIFHYVYGLLHHPHYRERYQANLKRDLPRLPFAPDFRAFAQAGARLAEIHVGYEEMPVYPLTVSENPDLPLDWRVEKMKLSRDKTQLQYNDFLTLGGIPAKALHYRLGSRSALAWIIDQYRVKTDKRSGIVNDPNRADDPRYIVNLIGKVISVSLETVEIVDGLPALRTV